MDTQEQETAQTPMVKVVPEDEKSEPVKKLILSDEEARDILFNSGHAHPEPGVDYTKIPEPPPGDTFFQRSSFQQPHRKECVDTTFLFLLKIRSLFQSLSKRTLIISLWMKVDGGVSSTRQS